MELDPTGVPLFADLDDAMAVLANVRATAKERYGAEVVRDAFALGYTAEELDGYDTIFEGEADDFKHESPEGLRFLLSRCGIEDGEPFTHTVTIERQIDGRWVTVARYDGGEIEEKEDGEEEEEGLSGIFRLAIKLGNAEMLSAAHLSEALEDVVERLQSDVTNGSVMDVNGNIVGQFAILPEEA